MQFTQSRSAVKVKESLFTPAPTPFEDLIDRIKKAIKTPKCYVIPEGQSITLADLDHIEDFQKLKQIRQAIVDENFVDKLLAYELINKIEGTTVHLRLFPDFWY